MIYSDYRKPVKAKKSKKKYIFLVVLAAFLIFVYFKNSSYSVKPYKTTNLNNSAKSVSIKWPSDGEAAVGAVGYGVLASSNTQQQAKPIASTAKIMAAYAVLKQKPLQLGEQGPLITINSNDVAIYQSYLAADGSIVPVNVGEKISEYQALQALLLPSANNIADTLAIWAFGSIANYQTYANNLAKQMGLKDSFFSDPSGFAPQTVSTPNDLVTLGMAAMAQPVFAQIVSQTQANIPVAGSVKNVNRLLGSNGIVGIKTGNTDQAGGCFVFASKKTVGKQDITLVGAVTGSKDLSAALNQSNSLIGEALKNFEAVKVVSSGQKVAEYKTNWGSLANAVASKDVEIIRWRGSEIKISVSAKTLSNKDAIDSAAGEVQITSGAQKQNAKLILDTKIPRPSYWWRLLHFYSL